MAYINGSNLRIFPASNRSAEGQQNNNWLTEFNLSSIVNQLIAGTDIKGFVITEGTTPPGILPKNAGADSEIIKNGVDQSLEFNIAGYYFQVTSVKNLVSILNEEESATTPASYLTFLKKDVSNENPYLDYSAGDVVYSATAYLSTDAQYRVLLGNDKGAIPEDSNGITLDLFYKRNGKYYIPASSRINFSGIQTFKHKGTRTQFTVKGAQITNYVIDDGEL